MKRKSVALVTIVLAFSAAAISFAQRRTEPVEKPITGDFKITVRTTISGQATEGTTMIKGKRERSETNMSVGGMNISSVNVTQCDLRRTIQINDRARKYLITPMDSEDSSRSGGIGTGSGVGTGVTGDTSRRGGVVTMTINTVDTGERKEMFGFTARHLKRSMSMESSPDACSQQQMRTETDGWYINLEYGLSCSSERPPQVGGGRPAPRGCQDRYQYKRTGPTNLGYPLIETTTMYGRDGAAMFTSSKEVIELSRQPLDAALFDVPAGYTQAQSQQEMSSMSMADVMAMSDQQGGHQNNSSDSGQGSMSGMPAAKSAARVKVGVVEFNNKTKSAVSTSALRDQLIALLNGDGIDAVALNASSASEAAMEAKAKGCAYVLFTDISTMKAPSTGQKLGGMLGRAAGIGGGGGKAEAKFDFRLLPAGGTSPTVQSSAAAKEDTEQSTVNTALENEAKAVAAALPRN